jgi:aryl-alcohol dehydrogenase-like predicted oxidoreductase
VIPYFALASGFLTAKYHSEAEFLAGRRGGFHHAAFETRIMFEARGQRILSTLRTVAHELGITPAQVSLAWLVARGVTAPIASATSVDQLKQLMRGVMVELPPGALALLHEASAANPSHTAGVR